MIFQQLKSKKNLLKTCSKNGFGLLLNCIVKKKNCIARERARKKNCIGIVLQEKGVVGLVCIARGELYCKRMHVVGKLYCNMVV